MSLMKIGDLFELEKGLLQSSKNIEGEYDFITAAEEWKTNNEYSHECEALIFAAAASGSLGRTHYVNGKFITSDLCFILTPKDEVKYPIDLKFYHFVFNSLKEDIVKNTKTGTSKESINQGNLKNYEIPYFGIEQQHLWIDKLLNTKSIKETLENEILNQQNLLTKLKQSILQEAIEGKLTAKWREENQNIEPASILLEKIQVEKEQLIKEKKIKKSKPLAEISEEEIPFEIPDSWEWCRLGNIMNTFVGGNAYNSTDFIENSKNQVLRLGNIRPSILRLDTNPVFIKDNLAEETTNYKLLENDILITMTGTRGKRDYCYTVLIDKSYLESMNLFLNQRVGCFRLNSNVISKFYDITMKNDILLDEIYKTATGSANQANIGSTALNLWVLPVPPKEEQKEIVNKIEKLFVICDELEEQINNSKQNIQTLMQAVLKEAFEK